MKNTSEQTNNTTQIQIKPKTLRIINYDYDTLHQKISSTPFMCPELKKLLDYCDYLQKQKPKKIRGMISLDLTLDPVMYTLFLLEDALNKKLTFEEFNEQRKRLLGDRNPWTIKLGLLLIIVGTILSGVGLFLGCSMGFSAPGAAMVAKPLSIMGGLFIGGGVGGFFSGLPPIISEHTLDAGSALYTKMSLSS